MKYALIDTNSKIQQIEPESFPVAAGLSWVPCPDNASLDTHIFDGVSVVPDTEGTIKAQAKAQAEQGWVVQELNQANIEITYHQDGNPRAKASEAAWRAYRVALCDYVRDNNGVLTVVGDRPVRPGEPAA